VTPDHSTTPTLPTLPQPLPEKEGGRARSAIVVGGGLAGIAAAVRLAQRGAAVTLVETRQRLGGRATSFVDPTTGQVLDNCQHVLLGCCTNLIDLYEHLGVADAIEWHRRLYFVDVEAAPGSESPRIHTLEAGRLPAPLHMTGSMLHFKALSLREKLAIARGMLAMMRLGRTGRDAAGDVSFDAWLRAHGQPQGAIDKFWSVIVVSAINELPERMAACHAIQVFQEGFLASADAYVMGLPGVPLVRLYDAAERVIKDAGGTVMLSTSAEGFQVEGERVVSLRIDGGRELKADAFVSAVPFDRLLKLLPADAVQRDPRFAALDRFTVSPILGIHLWFRRADAAGNGHVNQPVMDLPHLVLIHSPLQWLFNKGFDPGSSGSDADGSPGHSTLDTRHSPLPPQHLHGVISAAHDWVDQPADAVIAMAVAEVRKVLPKARDAELVHARVVKEKRATFSAAPGSDAWRPTTTGPIANLILAGDWTRTGWPATMEGAVRSGYAAADAVAQTQTCLIPDMPPSRLYRMLAR
jgi:squalene-associated FAD-dependent desaturase